MSLLIYIDQAAQQPIDKSYSISAFRDFDMCWIGGYIYSMDGAGRTVTVHDPVALQLIKTITLSNLPVLFTCRGITFDGSNLVTVMWNGLSTAADELRWYDIDTGNLIKNVPVSDGKINKYTALVWSPIKKMQQMLSGAHVNNLTNGYLYVLDDTADTTVIFDVDGTVIRTISLTAGKTYSGVTWDGASLWYVRTDLSDSGKGTIEHREPTDGSLIESFAFPAPQVGAIASPAITFNGTYLVLTYELPAPVDDV